jgi:ribonuclease R
MRKVMHGDRVLASVTGVDRSGRREGAIVEVLERRLTRLIGRYTLEAGIGYVVPDDRRIQRNVLIAADSAGEAKHGQLVVAEITQAQDAQRPADRPRVGRPRRQADRIARGRGRDPRPRDPA